MGPRLYPGTEISDDFWIQQLAICWRCTINLIWADANSEHSVDLETIGSLIIQWIGLGMGCAVVLGCLCLLLPRRRGSFLPPLRQRAVPWGLAHFYFVLVALLAAEWIIQWVVGLVVGSASKSDAINILANLWANLGLRATQFVLAYYIMRVLAQAGRLQLGFSSSRWLSHLMLGAAFWFLITPLVYAVNLAVNLMETPEPHPIMEAAELSMGGPVLYIILLNVILLAPVCEEFLFRGLIQPWLVKWPIMADAILFISMVIAAISGVMNGGTWPFTYMIAVGGSYVLFERLMRPVLRRPGAGRAIVITSVLFAAIHANVWPTPIPLFFFALGLGVLQYRTQSLIGPIVAHSLFNLYSSIQFFL